jgi:gluconolactonase
MIGPWQILSSELFARLPVSMHWQGEPNEWVRTTRPGMRLHSFLEGPCFDAKGDLWLVDVPHGRIFRVDAFGEWQLACSYEGQPHSIKVHQGHGFAIADHRLGLMNFDHGTVTVREEGVAGRPFLGLSDLACAPNGDLWITDSGRTSLTAPHGRVLRRGASGEMRIVLDNVPYPNGIAVSPDGAFVYVAATRSNQIVRLSALLPETGMPMSGTFIQLSGGLGPDGLAVSTAGHLAVAQAQAGRAYLFTALGDPLARIDVPEGLWTTSVAFGPPTDPACLFIVEAQSGSVYRADLSTIEGFER